MGQHGLINWHEDDKKCYELTLELVGRAAEAIAKKDRGEKTFGGEKVQIPRRKREESPLALDSALVTRKGFLPSSG